MKIISNKKPKKIDKTAIVNINKKTLFSKDERKDMAEQSLKHLNNIVVHRYDGLVIEYAQSVSAIAIIRGIRAISDFDYEIQLSQVNRTLVPDIYTIFLAPHKDYVYLNSSAVRELASYGASIKEYVTDYVGEKTLLKFSESKKI